MLSLKSKPLIISTLFLILSGCSSEKSETNINGESNKYINENSGSVVINEQGANQVQSNENIIVNNINSNSAKPVFVYNEPIEEPYFNEWFAQRLNHNQDIEDFGLEVLILGEGKTVEFSGILNYRCDGKHYDWRSVQNFQTTLSDDVEIMEIVPQQVLDTTCRIFYHGGGSYM